MNRITINGYSADVLSDTGVLIWAERDGQEIGKIENPSTKERREFFSRMYDAGATVIYTWRSRYVNYTLRSVMAQASGHVIDEVRYVRKIAEIGGGWVENKRSRRQDVKASI